MKWGLFGGTFDPIHMAHLRCAQEVLELFDLNRVIFIPASEPPHKAGVSISSFYHRHQMVRHAIETNPSFSVSDVESQRPGKSYSIETIQHFLDKYLKDIELYFILGLDSFYEIQSWKDWKNLLNLCHFIIMTRPGYEAKGLAGYLPPDFASRFHFEAKENGFRGPTGNYIYFREVTFLDISGTDIRKRLSEGKSVMYLVPEEVRQYILKHGLYQEKAV
ncbi:MAG TPA: nicotinate-nucleotide adenylyltransferase [Syntrophales bacterium]|nr:nicotinate-nucleotide adenylyltransferase [Syntrophales bacterium]HPX10846.1 nicotinate-nucleotide adenylyltransferase [Syntrophales bacterium]HQB30698.1 nicotinate-nucleotide adenylyltransferase [Syntrophales bacterium]HQN78886.1 nicotinate-nucleotide adenylyltransferase [Syntrophales bacterium]HQQ26452.1 nicotinate-nucleotide adenylyltransferase [Syntrophales bacterium]